MDPVSAVMPPPMVGEVSGSHLNPLWCFPNSLQRLGFAFVLKNGILRTQSDVSPGTQVPVFSVSLMQGQYECPSA